MPPWAVKPRLPSRSHRSRGDDVLAIKGNQETLAAEVEEAFIEADAQGDAGVASAFLETVERGHGRLETRRYRPLGDCSGVPRSALWAAMNMMGTVESRRAVASKVSIATRFVNTAGILRQRTRFSRSPPPELLLGKHAT